MASRKRSVKTASAKTPASNPQLTVKTGNIGGTIPQARTGGLPSVSAMGMPSASQATAMAPAANPQMATTAQTANAQIASTPQAANPQMVATMSPPQMPSTSPLPNNVNNQQAVAATPPAVAAPRKKAQVKTAKPKAQVAQAGGDQPSSQAMMQEASPDQQKPTFNFFFAGKTPF